MMPAEHMPSDWRDGLPALTSGRVALRDLKTSDAAPLLTALATPEVSRYMPPPPTSADAFHRFIEWTWRERSRGTLACFALTLAGSDRPVGLYQVRRGDATSSAAEWGVALAAAIWGTGVFREAANLVIDFAFDALDVRRLEARASVENGRGRRALEKLGAVQEGLLRRSLWHNGRYHDEALYAILEEDWQTARLSPRRRRNGPRGVAAPLAPGAGIELCSAQPGMLQREQVVACGHPRAAVAHDAIGGNVARGLE
jgi:RimJ/RimL family protein N-acetyltransferase